MASREQFLDDYEISRLLCDIDNSEDDRHSDDDIGLSGSEDEEDAVEEDRDNDIDSVNDVADNGNHGELENTNDEHSETGESTDKETNVYQGKNFTWSRTHPKVARARRGNITVRLPVCVDEAKNANTPHDAFSLFISDDILNVILTHTNQKIHDYLCNFTGKIQKWMRRRSLDELRVVIGVLIYGGVFESSQEHIESLYKMDGTGRLIFPAVMAKNRFRFLMSVNRFDNKATRTERRLEDKMAEFREFWDMFIGLCKSLHLVGSAVCIDELLHPFRGRCGFRQYMPKKCADLSLNLKKTPCRALKTTRRYQESEGAVMYAAVIKM